MRSSVRVAAVAAIGYALLEMAFFAHRNQLLPWEASHVALAAIFFALHFAVAMAGSVAFLVIGTGQRFRSLMPFIPIATLFSVHAISFFRERYYALPRDLGGTLGTLGLGVIPFLVAILVAGRLRKRPDDARTVATAIAFLVVLVGVFRVATVEPMGSGEATPPRVAGDRVEARATGARVFVFGFDGATWDVLDPLIADGRLPNLAALASRGRTFALDTIRPTFSPVIWTSVATGKDRFQHGIHDVVQTRLPGGTMLHRSIERTAFLTKTTGVLFRAMDAARLFKLAPYRSGQVNATSVWEVASEAGLSASQIEWYVSWPARPLNGVTVSDRFHLQSPGGTPISGLVSPEALSEPLQEQVVTEDDISVEQVLEFVDTEGLDVLGRQDWVDEHAAFVDEMRLNLARDLTTRNVTVDLLSRDQDWDLFGTYFRAVDLTHHLTWRYRGAKGDRFKRSELRLRPTITRYHEFMDRIVGEVLAEVPKDAVVLLVSDHGFEDRFAHSRAPRGVAILAGGPVTPSPDRGRMGIYDVAPTVAAILGLPVAADLQGRARLDLMNPAFARENPVRPISTWERVDRNAVGDVDEADPSIEDAEIERLRALGYLR
ncbi:MAG: hypothetical protein DHS20C21_23200 [Gemmatimonadota bacterium]|nr:MAG: hypothetical protein DHS20C21_23200 [Gemmatimonadota bacterium]